jgi:L-ribulose-5-phosphate 3-epimerase
MSRVVSLNRPLGAFSDLFPLDSVAEFRHYGMTCVQWRPSEESLASDEAAREEIRRFTDAGLNIVALAGYQNLVAADGGLKMKSLAVMRRMLQLTAFVSPGLGVATETGTKHLESPWEFHPDNVNPATWQELILVVRELLAEAERLGVRVLLEGYVNNVLRTASDAERLQRELSSPALGFVMDPFNLFLEEQLKTQQSEQARIFAAIAHRAPIAHAKDLIYLDGKIDTPRAGQGVFDYPTYFQLLDRYSPGCPLIVEHLEAAHLPSVLEYLEHSYQNSRRGVSSDATKLFS